ncbi:MAG: 2,3-bisphosphoglycerate-independent phosphoglycerate mutase [Candidatus Dojkabacteria bacterium]|nr:MAG: 2,3-bisphosphoglycerate-independent phosphoglycerate mutase [Candidatus Dojkabacteria bacterium]
MDGVGVAEPGPGNAVTLAKTSNLDRLWYEYPHTYLEAASLSVGLPVGTDGNSEVGHMTMGAGKVIFQDLPRIDNSIQTGAFQHNPVLKEAFRYAKDHKSNIHVMGLVGKGKVHSSFEHLKAIIDMASAEDADSNRFFIHAFTDGRDSGVNDGLDLLDNLEIYCKQRRIGRIASIIGRAYAMDRDERWDRTQKAYNLITEGIGEKVKDWRKRLKEFYKKGVSDEYIEPLVILDRHDSYSKVGENDVVIFFNFRPDRAIQLTKAFEDKNFRGFDRSLIPGLFFVGLTSYEDNLPSKVAFPPEDITMPLGKVLSLNGLTQLRIAESEKFPHVTYFFNGGNEEVLPGETYVEIPSPKDVATYDLKPEMSMEWVTTELIKRLETGKFDFALINFAGPDMVGHTGVIDATIKSMEICDQQIGRIVKYVLNHDGAVVITADHGNAEEMINTITGEPDTKHSTNPVPFLAVKKGLKPVELPVGGLADVAPTILAMLGLEIPAEMTGRNLLEGI